MNTPYRIEDNPHKGNKGLMRAMKAAINSWNGLKYAYQEESAFRQELALAIILIPTALILPVGYLDQLLMISSVLLVLIVELLNSSVEAAIDRISYELNDLSKRAKDFGSAAVMLALVTCITIWASIIYHTFFN